MWGINKEQLENQLMKIQAKNGLVCCGLLGVLAIATLTFYSGMLDPIINFIGNKIGQWNIEKMVNNPNKCDVKENNENLDIAESDNSALSLSHFSKFENESILVGSFNDGDIPQSGEDDYFFPVNDSNRLSRYDYD